MLKLKKLISVMCTMAILLTSVFVLGTLNTAAAGLTDGEMLKITSTAGWGNVYQNYNFENGKTYNFSAEYCIKSTNLANANTAGKDIFIFRVTNGDTTVREEHYIANPGPATCSFDYTITTTNMRFEIGTNSKDGSPYTAYAWNFTVTDKETGEELEPTGGWTAGSNITIESVPYDEANFLSVYTQTPGYNSWSISKPTCNLNEGNYEFSFDYFIGYDVKMAYGSTSTENTLVFKTQATVGGIKENASHWVINPGKGHHIQNLEVTSVGDVEVEIASKSRYSGQSYTIYFWNVKITNKETGKVYSNIMPSASTVVDYDTNVLGFLIPMYKFDNTDKSWNTVDGTFYNLPNDTYTLKFDYYVSKDISLSTDKNTLKTLLNWTNGGGRKEETYASESGVYSHSQEFTVDGNQLYFEVGANKKSGTDFTVYIWNLRLEDSHGNAYYTYFKTNNNVTEQAYDEEDMINTVGAMPVVLGAKIKTDLSKVDAEQKLRIDVDFTNINEFADIKEYGVIAVPANKADMTLSDILDTDSKQQVTRYKEADGDAGLVSVIVTRGVNSYGKRIALVAYVKTANGTYYTDVISKSVMGVMKSIFSSETNLATEGITADKITTAHSSIDKYNIITGKTVDEISKIFKDYTGYGNTTPTIVVGNNDYENAKKITAATFFYAKHS